jgi:hypothetical protein
MMDGKKRVIIDYSKLTDDLLRYLVEKYPDGYDDRDVISFKNAKNETIEAIKVETDETIYLVKISTKLEQTMEDFELDDDDDDDDIDDDFDADELAEDIDD